MQAFANTLRNEVNNDEIFLKFIEDVEEWLIK